MRGTTKFLTGTAVLVMGMVALRHPADAATFSNPAPITLPGPGPGGQPPTPGNPYPSNIVVSGLSGTVTDVNVTLNGFDCSARGNDFAYPEDVDILLVGPTGANVIPLSDIGGANQTRSLQFTNLTISLDDEAANPLPADTQLSASGSYRPTDDDDDPDEQAAVGNNDPFASPAPAPSTATALSVFDGTAPNGTWSLYVVDDYPGPDNCAILRGWTVEISTTGDATTTTTGPSTTVAPTTTVPSTTTTVAGPNQPPVAVNDAYTTAMNTPLAVPAPGVLANDSDPNGDPLTAGMPTQPNNGTLNLSTNGGFTYTPYTGFTGTDTFTYMAHDPSGGMSTATVTITVTGTTTTTGPTTTTTGPTTTTAPTTTTTTAPTTTTTTAPTTTTTTAPTTTTTVAPTTTTTVAPTTTTTVAPTTTTTVAPTTTTMATTTTTVSSTTTTVGSTTTTVPSTTSTSRPGDCLPGKGNPPGKSEVRPGVGKGDKNHEHCGPPGLNARSASSTRPLPTGALLAGLAALLMISLVLPFRRSRGKHGAKR